MIKRIITSLFLMLVLGLTNAHAQSRLTPEIGVIFYGKGELTDYETELNSSLLPSTYRFAYIVKPSFRREYGLACTYNGDSLILRRAEIPIWPIDKPKKVPIKEYKLKITSAISDSISNLIKSAVLSSSYLSHKDVIDGVGYTFISWPYTAMCRSPYEGSNCDRLVTLTDSICKAVELQDSKLIKGNLKEISELTKIFKTLYNEKPTEENPDIYYVSDNEHNCFQGIHFIIFLLLTFLSFIIIGTVSSICFLFDKKLKRYWWIPLLGTITICIVIFGIAYFVESLEL